MLNIPRLFLYVDFFSPLLFIFIIIFLRFIGLKFLLKELTYKFLVDYLAKNSIYKIKNLKFMDLFLNNIISKGFSLSIFNGLFFSSYIKSLNFNSVVILIFFVFLIF